MPALAFHAPWSHPVMHKNLLGWYQDRDRPCPFDTDSDGDPNPDIPGRSFIFIAVIHGPLAYPRA